MIPPQGTCIHATTLHINHPSHSIQPPTHPSKHSSSHAPPSCSKANLEGVTLFGALAVDANFSGANLRGADLELTVFEGADLSDAVLEGAMVS